MESHIVNIAISRYEPCAYCTIYRIWAYDTLRASAFTWGSFQLLGDSNTFMVLGAHNIA